MRRKNLKKKHEINNWIANDTNEQLQRVGTLKYINFFTIHVDTHIQRVSYIISRQYMILNVFLPFFLSFSLSLN